MLPNAKYFPPITNLVKSGGLSEVHSFFFESELEAGAAADFDPITLS
jgi:hypothetical protein